MKAFHVHGYALVPMEAEMTVIAENEDDALEIAQCKFRERPSEYLIVSSYDHSAASDWRPSVDTTTEC